MNKVFIVMKRRFADFDIPIEEPICATLSPGSADNIAAENNNSRSQKDLKDEITYLVKSVKLKV